MHRSSLASSRAFLAIIAAALSFLSCKKDETPPLIVGPTPSGFSLKIAVTDTSEHPVPGLRISAWNTLTGVPFRGAKSKAMPSRGTLAVSTIGFDVAAPARVILSILDLDNSLAATVFDRNVSNTGSYVVNWSIRQNVPTRVYKCLLVAQDTATSAVLFRDSVYAVLWQRDASVAIIGWTAPLGTYETHDSLLFPNVLSLPPMVLTDATGPTPLGTFAISDTITVILADTSTRRSQTYQRIITRGENTMKLDWAPPGPAATPEAVISARPQLNTEIRFKAQVHTSWALHQNYPNPFD